MIFNITQKEMRVMALKWIDVNENYIIELGCSNGNFAELLYNIGVKNYLGIDILKNKIKEAENKLPEMIFLCGDILDRLDILKGATQFISFQCLEHIQGDLKILNVLTPNTKIIISVPNSPYKGHVRWFELEGWRDRFSKYIDFDYTYVIQNPKKVNKRAFLFRGVRNDYKD